MFCFCLTDDSNVLNACTVSSEVVHEWLLNPCMVSTCSGICCLHLFKELIDKSILFGLLGGV